MTTLSGTQTKPLTDELLARMDAYWRAANYLSIGQIYLCENPLLREPLQIDHIKPRLLGHFGTCPGLNLIYIHLNRLIKAHNCDVLYIAGPGHGGPALVANTYLEGTYTDVFPDITQDTIGMRKMFRQFSSPGGVPSHAGPQTPGSIHEGGELGYALVHAFGAAFDNPDLLVACVVGDGEAETGPLEGGWKGNKFLNPATDGAVLPILHLNGYKISGPTVYARIPQDELLLLMRGHGYDPIVVEGDDPPLMHQAFAAALDGSYEKIRSIQEDARSNGFSGRPAWPMIVLRTPKGWTGPTEVDGVPVEGTFRAHQVPLASVRENPGHLKALEAWLRSYRPEELFDADGKPTADISELVPAGDKRMGATSFANGGKRLIALDLPDHSDYALNVPAPGAVTFEAPRKLGELLRDVFVKNKRERNFRLFCPDETNSNRLNAVFDVTTRTSVAQTIDIDDHVSPDGRVMEVLSEHCCQGWMEGYLLTGRHGLFPTYEAFAQVIDSMMNQHAKWLKTCDELPWRRDISSFNYLLTSHAWRNDHNGYSHQGPGFIDTVLNKKSSVTRVYLPPDTNCLLSVADHCLRSRNYINLIVCGKQEQLQWLDMAAARAHCSQGLGIWDFCSTDGGRDPDIVLACAGDVPTIETVAAAWLLRKHMPDIRVRVVNVVNLLAMSHPDQHPNGIDQLFFNEIFTPDKHVIFAFHGYPRVIHDLVHGRSTEGRFHVRGYLEEGTTTTPFDMVVLNRLSRFHLALDAIKYLLRPDPHSNELDLLFREKLKEHEVYTRKHLQDMPEICNWVWADDFSDPPADKAPPRAEAVAKQVFTDA